jgi:hypothetical protein
VLLDSSDADLKLHPLVDFPVLKIAELLINVIDFRTEIIIHAIDFCDSDLKLLVS